MRGSGARQVQPRVTGRGVRSVCRVALLLSPARGPPLFSRPPSRAGFPTAAARVPGRAQPEAHVSLLDGNPPGPGLQGLEFPRPKCTQNQPPGPGLQGPPGLSSWARSCRCITRRSPPRSPASLSVSTRGVLLHTMAQQLWFGTNTGWEARSPRTSGVGGQHASRPSLSRTQPVCAQRVGAELTIGSSWHRTPGIAQLWGPEPGKEELTARPEPHHTGPRARRGQHRAPRRGRRGFQDLPAKHSGRQRRRRQVGTWCVAGGARAPQGAPVHGHVTLLTRGWSAQVREAGSLSSTWSPWGSGQPHLDTTGSPSRGTHVHSRGGTWNCGASPTGPESSSVRHALVDRDALHVHVFVGRVLRVLR